MGLEATMRVFRGELEYLLTISGNFFMRRPGSTSPHAEDPIVTDITAVGPGGEVWDLTDAEKEQAETLLWDTAAERLCRGAS